MLRAAFTVFTTAFLAAAYNDTVREGVRDLYPFAGDVWPALIIGAVAGFLYTIAQFLPAVSVRRPAPCFMRGCRPCRCLAVDSDHEFGTRPCRIPMRAMSTPPYAMIPDRTAGHAHLEAMEIRHPGGSVIVVDSKGRTTLEVRGEHGVSRIQAGAVIAHGTGGKGGYVPLPRFQPPGTGSDMT